MSKLDEIFRKRLNRIREELSAYITSHGFSTEQMPTPLPTESSVQEYKHGDVQDKFLNYMKITLTDADDSQDDYLEDEYEDADDACKIQPPRKKTSPKPLKSQRTEAIPHLLTSFPNMTGGGALNQSFNKHLNLDDVLAQKEESFSEMLLRLIDEKGLKDSDVYKRANIDRRLFSKIRGDEDYVPSKKTAISFCLALALELDEAKKLLATAGYALSASSRFDLIIMYLIENCEYNIHFANIVLDDYGEGTLSR